MPLSYIFQGEFGVSNPQGNSLKPKQNPYLYSLFPIFPVGSAVTEILSFRKTGFVLLCIILAAAPLAYRGSLFERINKSSKKNLKPYPDLFMKIK